MTAGIGSTPYSYSTPGISATGKASSESAEKAGRSGTGAKDSAEISALAKKLAGSSEFDNVNTTKTAEQKKYDTVEAKEAEGAWLDAILKDLRGKYSEEEAMSRFNDFMRSQGYEIYEKVEDSTKPTGSSKLYGSKSNASYSFFNAGGNLLFTNGMPLKDPFPMSNAGSIPSAAEYNKDRSTMLAAYESPQNATYSFSTTSTVDGRMVNGKIQYDQATWAKYNAGLNSDFEKTMEFWKKRNTQELTEQAGFDVGQYVEDMSLYWGKAFAAESVSTDLGSMVNDILNQAGIKLEPGQNLNLRIDYEGTTSMRLIANTDFGDEEMQKRLQSILNAALSEDPNILSAFKAESDRVAEYDLTALEGAYSNSTQSNKFLQQRLFTMSGNHPSTIVMGSGLDHRQTGYTYIKKLSNSFDANADQVDIRGKSYTTSTDPEEYARMKSLFDELKQVRSRKTAV